MASEMMAVDASDLQLVRNLLLDAIRAKHELDSIRKNIEKAAESNLPASALIKAKMLPRPVDIDIYMAAEMVLVLGVAHSVEA